MGSFPAPRQRDRIASLCDVDTGLNRECTTGENEARSPNFMMGQTGELRSGKHTVDADRLPSGRAPRDEGRSSLCAIVARSFRSGEGC